MTSVGLLMGTKFIVVSSPRRMQGRPILAPILMTFINSACFAFMKLSLSRRRTESLRMETACERLFENAVADDDVGNVGDAANGF